MQTCVNLTIDDELKQYRFQYYPINSSNEIDDIGNYLKKTDFPTKYRAVMGTRAYGSIFVELANIEANLLINELKKRIQLYIDEPTKEEILFYDVEEILKRQFGIIYGPTMQIMMLELTRALERIRIFLDQIVTLNIRLNTNDLSTEEQLRINNSIRDAKVLIDECVMLDSLENACNYCRDYCSLVTQKHNINFGHTSMSLRCDIVLSCNNNITMSYRIEDLFEIAGLEHFKVASSQIPIKECENCGKYFIPSTRSDEKYCDNYYKDGKTCKELGYEIKLKKDKFKTTYRSAYKTQRARIKYNSHITNYEELHFKPWEQAAKQALSDFTTKNDIEGFKKWLIDNKDSF
ncbi:DUF6076 domain-containing protein [Lacrimispora sp.]|uniref:DUF6076 domain-containing protein n=1 Tax=Lacrimispora sp. TaxID=2719234 RepID=UPI00289D267B|nr:DUF6076 domain-containing protein [Lacrimispora sp.]